MNKESYMDSVSLQNQHAVIILDSVSGLEIAPPKKPSVAKRPTVKYQFCIRYHIPHNCTEFKVIRKVLSFRKSLLPIKEKQVASTRAKLKHLLIDQAGKFDEQIFLSQGGFLSLKFWQSNILWGPYPDLNQNMNAVKAFLLREGYTTQSILNEIKAKQDVLRQLLDTEQQALQIQRQEQVHWEKLEWREYEKALNIRRILSEQHTKKEERRPIESRPFPQNQRQTLKKVNGKPVRIASANQIRRTKASLQGKK